MVPHKASGPPSCSKQYHMAQRDLLKIGLLQVGESGRNSTPKCDTLERSADSSQTEWTHNIRLSLGRSAAVEEAQRLCWCCILCLFLGKSCSPQASGDTN